jgi:hypothetical protein
MDGEQFFAKLIAQANNRKNDKMISGSQQIKTRGEGEPRGRRPGRPNKIPARRFVAFSVSMPPDMLEATDHYCDENHISRAYFTRLAMKYYWHSKVGKEEKTQQ